MHKGNESFRYELKAVKLQKFCDYLMYSYSREQEKHMSWLLSWTVFVICQLREKLVVHLDWINLYLNELYCIEIYFVSKRPVRPVSNEEMPTSGDLKSVDSLFFTTSPPPAPNLNSMNPAPPPHPRQISKWLRTLYEVLHEVHTLKICDHRFDARNNCCQWLNAPETVQRIRKIQVLS